LPEPHDEQNGAVRVGITRPLIGGYRPGEAWHEGLEWVDCGSKGGLTKES